MKSLQKLRSAFGQGIIGLLWMNVLLVALASYSVAHVSVIAATGSAVLVALVATVTWLSDRTGPVTQIVTSMAMAALVALMVYAYSGHRYQVEHPYVLFCHARSLRGLVRLARHRGLCGRHGRPSLAAEFCSPGRRISRRHRFLARRPPCRHRRRAVGGAHLDRAQSSAGAREVRNGRCAGRERPRGDRARRRESQDRRPSAPRRNNAGAWRNSAGAPKSKLRWSRRSKSGLGRLSSGDLTFRLTDNFPRAYQEIKEEFNLSIMRLRRRCRCCRSERAKSPVPRPKSPPARRTFHSAQRSRRLPFKGHRPRWRECRWS